MKRLSVIASVFVALSLIPVQSQEVMNQKIDRYPNEVPGLRIYETAKWKSIVINVSTERDVEKVLGKSVPIVIEGIGQLAGYDYDSEWKIVVFYFDGGNGCHNCLIGRVTEISLWPKHRVSLKGLTFPPRFEKSGSVKNGVDFTVYRDKVGLLYSVYEHDSPDGLIHAGDLYQVTYSARYR